MNKSSNKGVQGTRHKVSGPLTPDVRRIKPIQLAVLHFQARVVASAAENAVNGAVATGRDVQIDLSE